VATTALTAACHTPLFQVLVVVLVTDISNSGGCRGRCCRL